MGCEGGISVDGTGTGSILCGPIVCPFLWINGLIGDLKDNMKVNCFCFCLGNAVG